MKIQICVGSTCHLCGSKKVVARIQELVEQNHMDSEIELSGKFCMGQCGEGVSVMVDGNVYSVKVDEVDAFFAEHVLKSSKGGA